MCIRDRLLREIKALQRIQTEQGKALEKMTTDNDYVAKVKALMDELRLAKEKIKEMDEKMKKDEKTMKSQFEHMMKLQEKCKELKAQALGQNPSGGSALSDLGAPGIKLKAGLA